mgnify:CR=1 FL=1
MSPPDKVLADPLPNSAKWWSSHWDTIWHFVTPTQSGLYVVMLLYWIYMDLARWKLPWRVDDNDDDVAGDNKDDDVADDDVKMTSLMVMILMSMMIMMVTSALSEHWNKCDRE